MPISSYSAVERIARVLAAQRLSDNAEGEAAHAADAVDMEWTDCVDTAIAVLKTLREPDMEMAQVGDVGTWEKMIAAALGDPHDL